MFVPILEHGVTAVGQGLYNKQKLQITNALPFKSLVVIPVFIVHLPVCGWVGLAGIVVEYIDLNFIIKFYFTNSPI